MRIRQKIKELREEGQMLQRELDYNLKGSGGYLSKIDRNQKNLRKNTERLSVFFSNTHSRNWKHYG